MTQPFRNYTINEPQRQNIFTALSFVLNHMGGLEATEVAEVEELCSMFEATLTLDNTTPAWQLPIFTPEEQERIVSRVMDEIADCSFKDLAHTQLESESYLETIGYACVGDPEDLARMLDLMSNSEQDYVTGSFLRDHDDDGDDYAGLLDFAKRFQLINETEDAVTDLGIEFKERFA